MNLLKIVMLLSVVLSSCSDNKAVDIPGNILPKEKMAEVIVDIHLLEATMNINGYNPNTAHVNDTLSPINVLKKNDINKKQYEESFEYYTQHPEMLNEIYQLVLNDLSKMQAEVMNKK